MEAGLQEDLPDKQEIDSGQTEPANLSLHGRTRGTLRAWQHQGALLTGGNEGKQKLLVLKTVHST